MDKSGSRASVVTYSTMDTYITEFNQKKVSLLFFTDSSDPYNDTEHGYLSDIPVSLWRPAVTMFLSNFLCSQSLFS